jgi:hypothetical protein
MTNKTFYFSTINQELRPNSNFHYKKEDGFYAYLKDKITLHTLSLIETVNTPIGSTEKWENEEFIYFSNPFYTEWRYKK